LFIIPDRFDRLPDITANSTAASKGGPVRFAFDGESSECVIERIGGTVKLFKSMARSDGKPKTFLATSDSGVVDGLHVYTMSLKKIVGRLLGLDGITDQDGYNMAGSGYDGDSTLGKALLYFADVPLHELTITIIRLLIDNRSMGTSDRDGRERCREDEARGVRPNHIDELGRTSNITTNCAVRFTKSAYKIL
jgi:hypothetical protein